MKKKAISLSSLILTQTLGTITLPSLSHAAVVNTGARTISSLSLEKNFKYNGGDYYVHFELELGSFLDSSRNVAVELMGRVYLNYGTSKKRFLLGDYDSDGNAVFQMVSHENNVKKYVAARCSSSFNDCESLEGNEKLELFYNENSRSWRVSMKTKFVSEFHQGRESISINIDSMPLHEK
ncbi:MAG: hypothetical protein KC505_11025 [Myxococcales bacterium]|nr:hypothetical protein [Myxococcales bacterium]USN50545.1 MAG: hypothetical protein H6731_09820 [Myxococcales bacterium]